MPLSHQANSCQVWPTHFTLDVATIYFGYCMFRGNDSFYYLISGSTPSTCCVPSNSMSRWQKWEERETIR
ncbi:hypothetical protein M3J09_012507 [Ascochyta lentis]